MNGRAVLGFRPLLREALRSAASVEARGLIETLLGEMRDIDVSDLDAPKGITLVTPDDLLAARLKDLRSASAHARSFALQDLSSLAALSDEVVPVLAETLQSGKDRHDRWTAAGC